MVVIACFKGMVLMMMMPQMTFTRVWILLLGLEVRLCPTVSVLVNLLVFQDLKGFLVHLVTFVVVRWEKMM